MTVDFLLLQIINLVGKWLLPFCYHRPLRAKSSCCPSVIISKCTQNVIAFMPLPETSLERKWFIPCCYHRQVWPESGCCSCIIIDKSWKKVVVALLLLQASVSRKGLLSCCYHIQVWTESVSYMAAVRRVWPENGCCPSAITHKSWKKVVAALLLSETTQGRK